MQSILFHYTATMTLVAAIVLVALVWARLSMLHHYQGQFLMPLWGTHGLHVLDLVALAVELLLLMALSIVVLAGLTRPR